MYRHTSFPIPQLQLQSETRLTAEFGILVRPEGAVLDVVAEHIVANALTAVRASLEPRRTLPRRCSTDSTSKQVCNTHTHTTHPGNRWSQSDTASQRNDFFSRTTWVCRYQKGKTNLDFTAARDSGISWAICKSAPRSRQMATPPLCFLQAGYPSCHPTNSVKALKAQASMQATK